MPGSWCIRRTRWTLAPLAVALSLAGSAHASDASARDETERWVPAFSVYGGATVQGAHGAVTSGQILGPWIIVNPNTTLGQPIRGAASGSDTLVTPFVGGAVELMTPGVASLPGKPRAFVHAGAAAGFGASRDLAKEGVTGPFEVPGAAVPSEVSISGQGSATSVETKTLMVRAGAGVAFTVEAWERRLRLKPSFEYLREVIEATGIVKRAAQFSSSPPITLEDDFREIRLEASEDHVYHGIGPGLEVEMDAGRAGPLMLTVFAGGQAYRFLGDLDFDFTATNEFDETAVFEVEKKPWAYQGGVGVRFRWLPEE